MTKKCWSLFAIMGLIYLCIEVVFRAIFSPVAGAAFLAFMGYSSLWMIPIGGLCGVLLGFLNRKSIFKKLPIAIQSVIGACGVLVVEFISGLILNMGFGLNLWSYASIPLNILGQVCLPFGILWFLICPFAFWLDDVLHHYVYGDEKPIELAAQYKTFLGQVFIWLRGIWKGLVFGFNKVKAFVVFIKGKFMKK